MWKEQNEKSSAKPLSPRSTSTPMSAKKVRSEMSIAQSRRIRLVKTKPSAAKPLIAKIQINVLEGNGTIEDNGTLEAQHSIIQDILRKPDALLLAQLLTQPSFLPPPPWRGKVGRGEACRGAVRHGKARCGLEGYGLLVVPLLSLPRRRRILPYESCCFSNSCHGAFVPSY